MDSKQRKIRSLRGFFLYALEIIENGKDHQILSTNLQPFFWKKVKNIIRQNKKAALQEFLFGGEGNRMEKDQDNKPHNQASNSRIQILEGQIQNIHNKVYSLQQKVIQLETFMLKHGASFGKNYKYPLSDPLESPNARKTIQHEDLPLKQKKA